MSELGAYHGDEAIKAKHVEMARRHLEQDILLAGTYGEAVDGRWRGCSVGCFAHEIDPNRGDHHEVVAEAAGWPLWLVRLSDALFEGLPAGEREPFHVRLREAVPVGADLEPVKHRLAIRRMDRLIALHADQPDPHGLLPALRAVRACHEAELGGSACDWVAAADSARSAHAAAYSAAYSAAEAARSAARSAAYSAEAAAYSAARAAHAAARSAAYSAEAAARSVAYSAARAAHAAARSAEAAADSAYSAHAAAYSAAYSAAAWRQEASDLIELGRLRGELLERADVDRAFAALGTTLRAGLEASVERLAPVLAAAPDRAAITALVRAELRVQARRFTRALVAAARESAREAA